MIDYSELYPVNNSIRTSIKLDGLWNFEFDRESIGEKNLWMNKLPNPMIMPVPASFSDFFTDKKDRDYTGDFWYETSFFAKKEKNMRVWLRFGSITHRGVVYVNGKKVGEHEGGFLPYAVDITDHINDETENVLSVKVNNELTEHTLPCGTVKEKKNGRKVSLPYFDFFNYSGIQRSVWLEYIPEICITDYDTTYMVDGKDAYIDYHIIVNKDLPNGYTVDVELFDEKGILCCKETGADGTLNVKDAHLWNERNAYLYKLRLTIDKNGKDIDIYESSLGIRTISVEDGKLKLNGKELYLRGFGKHEDFDVIGRGQSLPVMKRDYECMKWVGANCFRTSHYPYSEEWYQIADREGFFIIDEVPGVGMLKSIVNFLAAGTGHNETSFFEGDRVSELKTNHINAVNEMITRDKNHPSVIAFSLLNEPETTTESSYAYFKDIFDAAKEADIQKRPLTGALERTSSPTKCRVSSMMDFICLNRYYGWYIFGGIDFDEAKDMLKLELNDWKKEYPNVPIVFTEYGADTLLSEHKLPSVMWSQEYQKEMIEMYSEVFDSYDNVQGELVWNFADFQTGEGIMRVNGNKKGVFSRNRQPKDIAYFLKKRWERLNLG